MNFQAKIIISVLVLLFNITTFQTAKAQAQVEDKKVFVKIEVDGLSCPFCAYGLEKKLKELDGASNIHIDVKNGFATLEFREEKKPAEEKLRKVVKNAGFTARSIFFSSEKFKDVGR